MSSFYEVLLTSEIFLDVVIFVHVFYDSRTFRCIHKIVEGKY
jgi:hypothetical protein